MSDLYYRTRKTRYREPTVGDEFADWLTGQVMENYAHKISEYCNSMKTCEKCQFFNGTCRLNNLPANWSCKSF